MYTVEPPNKGQVGAWALVHYSGVVLYLFVFVKKPFLCVVSVSVGYAHALARALIFHEGSGHHEWST